MTQDEFLEQINSIPDEEHIAYKAISQKALREIFDDLDVYKAVEEIGKEDYRDLHWLFLSDEFARNDIYFVFCNWRGGKFVLFEGKKEEYLDVLVDTKEWPKEQERHKKQLDAVKNALNKHGELFVDSGLRFNENYELAKPKKTGGAR